MYETVKKAWQLRGVLVAGVVLCLLAAVVCVALAGLGSDRAWAVMRTMTGCVGILVFACACLAGALQRRWPAIFLHLGFCLVLAGWAGGQLFAGGATRGMMALVEGDTSRTLRTGDRLEKVTGLLPFHIQLESFNVVYYPGTDTVKEYRSDICVRDRVTGKETRHAVRVNAPARIGTYWIYQMSWGLLPTEDGAGMPYTVLECISDPLLPVVATGGVAVLLGVFLFAIQAVRRTAP